jgi:hypothetical protein
MSDNIVVGKEIAWDDTPDRAMVSANMGDQGTYYAIRIDGFGSWVGTWEDEWEPFRSTWEWEQAPLGLIGKVTVIALDVPIRCTAEQARGFAEAYDRR